jgi:hypothetical protein
MATNVDSSRLPIELTAQLLECDKELRDLADSLDAMDGP